MRGRALALTGMVLIFLFLLAFWLLTFWAVRGYADTGVPPDAYLGSTDWLTIPAALVAGQEEVVYCNLPPDSAFNGLTGLWEENGPGSPFVGHLIWMKADLCQLLWHPRTRDEWWLAGHAAEVLGHELAHDSLNDCGDKAADRDGIAMSGRILNTVLGYRGIRVHPKQRRWALAGARAEASGPVGLDQILVGCADYQGGTP